MKIKQGDYTVGELAKYYGISTDTVRLYDKKGILRPQKNDENGYRIYSRIDCITMEFIKRLRLMDIPLLDIEKILNEYSLEENRKFAKQRMDEIEKEIQHLKKVEGLLKEYTKMLEKIEEGLGKIEVRESPVFIFREPKEESVTETLEKFEQLDLDALPVPTIHFYEILNEERMEEVRDEEKRGELNIAFTVEDTMGITERPDFPKSEFQVIPSKKCVYTIVGRQIQKEYDNHEWIEKFAVAQGLKLTGRNVCRLLLTERNRINPTDYYELWYSIETE